MGSDSSTMRAVDENIATLSDAGNSDPANQMLPHIHLLTLQRAASPAFIAALARHDLTDRISVTHHPEMSLSALPSNVRFDLIVSPANSFALLDGAFDDAISRALSPKHDYFALTLSAQAQLFEHNRGYLSPGSCFIARIPSSFAAGHDLRYGDGTGWGCRFVGLCPTMRVPGDVRWDREVIYECIWSLLSAIERHNREAMGSGATDDIINTILMTPLASGTGRVSLEKWAEQSALAIKHWRQAGQRPERWGSSVQGFDRNVDGEIEASWRM